MDGNGYALPGRLVMVLYLGDVLGAVCVYAVCVCVACGSGRNGGRMSRRREE